ncbi:MAG: UPF0182 family protein [Micrococcales bacterium]|nr:UPF0182 family protein [Micrococcales bacterium]
MSATAKPRPAPPPSRRKRGPLVPTLVVVGGLVVLLVVLAQVWTEVLWFQQLGYGKVLYVEWGTKAVVGLLGLLVMAGAVFASMAVAYRSRPVYPPSDAEQRNLDQYREAIEPLRKVVMIVLPVVLGLFAAGAAAGRWADVQLFLHRQTFGTKDPQFGLDLGFYVFTLPLLRFVVSFCLATAVLSGLVGLATHYLYGGIRIAGRSDTPRTSRAARIQLATTGAVILVVLAGSFWLDQYSLLMKNSSKYAGAGYTDVNAVIPAKVILAIAALLVAAVFVLTAVRGNWRLPAVGVAVMIIAAIVVGGIYPAIVQRFQVQPNAQARERVYIERNIAATRAAYGIDQVVVQPYGEAEVTVEAGQLREDTETTASIRLLDPTIVSPSFKQQQQIRGFYSFPDTLAVDRYTIDGDSRDTIIAVRELDQSGLSASQRSWVNEVTVYTHGFGVVAAYGNAVNREGEPLFFESNIPSSGALGDYEPRIYFGQMSPEYSIVGGPAGACSAADRESAGPTAPPTPTTDQAAAGQDGCWELDYSSGDETRNIQYPTQTVKAGPSIGSPWNKLLFAIKFGSGDILFSDRVTPHSQILYDRDPKERVAKVAPYLTLDGRVYPAVVDGRVKWIVDGYTTTDHYPYSAAASLEDATTDSLTQSSSTVSALRPETVNYIRNSVKATVDAYDGSVDLYAWDPDDPILKAWDGIFPGTIQPMSKISGDLMSHLRYPENMFKVQRTLLGRYHETNPEKFYRGDDFWQNSRDPASTTVDQPPYYLTLKTPDQDAATFSLMSTFQPYGANARPVLTGYLAVDAEAGSVKGKKSDGYGKIRLLELPRNSTVPAPQQAQANFIANTEVSTYLNLLKQGDSTTLRGNLLTLPVGGSLLYVQPVYVQASAAGMTFPKLQKVLVSFGGKIGFADTLDEALVQVFGDDSGATPGTGESPDGDDPGSTETPPDTDQPPGTDTGTGTDTGARADLDKALQDAQKAIEDSQAALANHDWAAYGAAQDALSDAITRALDAEARL